MLKLTPTQTDKVRAAMRHYADMLMANSNADDYGVVYHGQGVVDALAALGVNAANVDRQIIRLMDHAKARRAAPTGIEQ
jgi:hypothetical protein